MISKNVGQAVSLSGLEQANSLSYDTLTAKMRIAEGLTAILVKYPPLLGGNASN
jgi:hypothetical protein